MVEAEIISRDVDRNGKELLWQQVAKYFREKAVSLGPEQPLPSERDVARVFQVQRATVRRAVDTLIAEGIVERRPSRGLWTTAVSPAGPISLLVFVQRERDERNVFSDSTGHCEALQEAARPYGHEVTPYIVLPNASSRPALLKSLHRSKVEGVVLRGFIEPDDVPFMESVAQAFPTVVMGKECEALPLAYVQAEYSRSSAAMARYLVGRGCRTLIAIAFSWEKSVIRRRCEAFECAAMALGIERVPVTKGPDAIGKDLADLIAGSPAPIGFYGTSSALEIQRAREMALARGLMPQKDCFFAACVTPEECDAEQGRTALAVREEAQIALEAGKLLMRMRHEGMRTRERVDIPCRILIPDGGVRPSPGAENLVGSSLGGGTA